MSTPPPHSVAMLVSWSGRTLNGQLAVVSGPWVNPRHGRGPRDQITALAKRGTVSSIYDFWFHKIYICCFSRYRSLVSADIFWFLIIKEKKIAYAFVTYDIKVNAPITVEYSIKTILRWVVFTTE